MKTARLTYLVFLVCSCDLEAQEYRKVFGYVADSVSAEKIVGAVVRLPGSGFGTVTNAFGFYSLSVPDTSRTMEARCVGYRFVMNPIDVRGGDRRIDIAMSPDPIVAAEVLVEDERTPRVIDLQNTGVSIVHMEEIRHFPSVAGEVDVLKAIHALPGVSTGDEYTNGFYVRGGNVDQNLVLLDGIPLYNTNHFFGYFSVFNGDALRHVELLKSGIGAEYGDLLSSVLNIHLKEGSREKLGVMGGVSIAAARATVEGPIGGDRRGSFLLSGRRTYLDPIFWLINSNEPIGDRTSIYFYDLYLKANYDLTPEDRMFITGYFGRDVIVNEATNSNAGVIWGNAAISARYNRIWSPVLFTNLAFFYSDYVSEFYRSGFTNWRKQPSIADVSMRGWAELFLTDRHRTRFGFEWTKHDIRAYSGLQEFENTDEARFLGAELAAYVSHRWTVSEPLSIEAGLRGAFFSLGSHRTIEPRVNIAYLLSSRAVVKASYTRHYQFMHLLSSVNLANPGDVYYPSTDFLPPGSADQWAVQFGQTADQTFLFQTPQEWSVEVYSKLMRHLPMFRSAFSSPNPEELRLDLLSGSGKAYGLELEYSADFPHTNLHASYTLSRTTRTFAGRNRGEPFAAKFDRTHQLFITADHRWKESWTVGAQWILASGKPLTPPMRTYFIAGGPADLRSYHDITEYAPESSVRMPLYNRLDLSLTYAFSAWEGSWELFLNLYNAYAYPNPIFIAYDGHTKGVQKFSFGFIPTLGVNFKY